MIHQYKEIMLHQKTITLYSVPNEAPNIIKAFATSSTSIYIKWSAVSDTNGAPLLGYTVFYRQTKSLFKPDVVQPVRNNVTKARIDNLNKFTSYVIRVLAFTGNGNGVASDRMTVSTDEDGKQLDYYLEVSLTGQLVNAWPSMK